MKATHCFFISLLLFLAAHGGALAQSSVDSRVQKLEETIRTLELRVASLEEQLRERQTSSTVASDKVNWRKLKKGMSESDVEKLLGSPSRVHAFGSFTVWHYETPLGGQVQFDGDRRTVTGWREP